MPSPCRILRRAVLLLGLIVPVTFPAAQVAAAGQPAPSSSGAIHEARFVTIGGIDQWITINGTNRDNPVILFLHGGPGNPMSAWSKSVYGDWEQAFTIVQWDQRGAGRTYGRNEPVEELTIERFHATELTVDRMVQDGIELSEFLRKHLGKDRIILTGTSWGSVLGLHMARARPELFHAYVGVSQIVSYERMMAASYAMVLGRARSKNDAAAIARLEGLGSPPWESPRNFGQLRRILRGYEYETTSAYPEMVTASAYDTDAERAAYAAGEELSFVKFVGFKNDGMGATIDFVRLGPAYTIPIFLLQGAEDLLTVPAITGEYFEQIKAPAKALIVVPAAGHDPNVVMIQAHLQVMKERVLPLIK